MGGQIALHGKRQKQLPIMAREIVSFEHELFGVRNL